MGASSFAGCSGTAEPTPSDLQTECLNRRTKCATVCWGSPSIGAQLAGANCDSAFQSGFVSVVPRLPFDVRASHRINSCNGAGLRRRARSRAVALSEEVVAASEYHSLQQQNRELQRVLGNKTMENEILHEALEVAQQKK